MSLSGRDEETEGAEIVQTVKVAGNLFGLSGPVASDTQPKSHGTGPEGDRLQENCKAFPDSLKVQELSGVLLTFPNSGHLLPRKEFTKRLG